jgi:hypothetical protein
MVQCRRGETGREHANNRARPKHYTSFSWKQATVATRAMLEALNEEQTTKTKRYKEDDKQALAYLC